MKLLYPKYSDRDKFRYVIKGNELSNLPVCLRNRLISAGK